MYENYIKIGSTPETLLNFPTPSSINRSLNDVDKDPFTDLQGFTQRNRVRDDVLAIDINYNYNIDDDMAYILNAIHPVWFYVELINSKTKLRTIHKMYASSKTFRVFKTIEVSSGVFKEEYMNLTFSLVEQ